MDIASLLSLVRPITVPSGDAALLVTSDWHIGSVLAPWPEAVPVDGMTIRQNKVQAWVDARWDAFFSEAREFTKGRRRILILNGEACEGRHHLQVELVTSDLTLQRRAALYRLAQVSEENDTFYVLRGSTAHSGPSGENDEAVAEALDCSREEITAAYSRYILKLDVNGVYLHFAHHIGTTQSPVSEATALVTHLAKAAIVAGRWGQRLPDIMGRAHRHQYCAVHLPGQRQGQFIFTTPAWVAKGEHGYRLDPTSPPQIGGVVILIDKDGHWHPHIPRFWAVLGPEVERA